MSWRGRTSHQLRGGYSQTAFLHDRRPWMRRQNQEGVPEPPPPPPPPLGALVERLRPEDLAVEAAQLEDAAVVTDLKTVTSFNWLDKKEPSILIPGAPPRWTPPADSRALAQDDGNYFRDMNAARFPQHPMEPAVLAGLRADPTLPRCINIVACGSTLGNLLRFVRNEDRAFRMLAETVGDTLFLVRRENSPTELLRGVYGYGHTFPEAYTTWDHAVRGSVSHQRLISYRFGRLNLLVRFEGDGYVPSADDRPVEDRKTKGQEEETPPSMDDLLGSLTDVQLGSRTQQPDNDNAAVAGSAAPAIAIKSAGRLVDQSAVFDLKTRSIRKKDVEDTIAGELSRCWVSQIPNFVLAYHDRGTFRDVQLTSVQDKVQKWEKDHRKQLSQFAALLHRLVDTISNCAGQKLELHRATAGELELRRQLEGVPTTLSPKLQTLWEETLARRAEGAAADQSADQPVSSEELAPEKDSLAWLDDDTDYTGCTDGCGYCGFCTY